METVKVDLQKLQLLNDRITQCIDALNQVRLSAHGLQHSSAQLGYAPTLLPQPMFAPQAGLPAQMPGIAHTTAFAPSVGPWGAGAVFPQVLPQQISPQLFPQAGVYGAYGGISHTSPFVDPWAAARVQQVFPFIGYNLPPVTIY